MNSSHLVSQKYNFNTRLKFTQISLRFNQFNQKCLLSILQKTAGSVTYLNLKTEYFLKQKTTRNTAKTCLFMLESVFFHDSNLFQQFGTNMIERKKP